MCIRDRVIAARRFIIERMVQTVMFGGVEQEAPPARRVEAHVDMLIRADRQSESARQQRRARQEIEEATHAQPDQEQLDRIADRALVDVELGDVVMHRMGQPQRIPVCLLYTSRCV